MYSTEHSPKGINKGKWAVGEIAEMVKYNESSPEALVNGKGTFGETAGMVKYQQSIPTDTNQGKRCLWGGNENGKVQKTHT